MAQQGVHYGDLITLSIEESQNTYLARLPHAQGDGLSVLSTQEHDNADALFTQSCVFRVRPTTLKNEKYENGRALQYGVYLKLEHVASTKVVSANPFANSDLERSNLEVTLEDYRDGDTNQMFKIMPRFRAQVEGDQVRLSEQVHFATRQSNQFLHVSAEVRGRQELNISASRTSFRVTGFATYHPEAGKYIKAGDVIRFFHKEVEGFLSAGFDYMANQEESLCEGDSVFVRTTRSVNKEKGHGSNQLWMVEFEVAKSGGFVNWSQRIRLKHVASGRYLALIDDQKYQEVDVHTGEPRLKLGLTNAVDDSGLWIFSPVTQTGSTITLSSYVRLIHYQTRRYLHTSAEWFAPDGTIMPTRSMTAKEFRRVIGGTEELHDEDVFQLKSVEESRIQLLRAASAWRQVLVDLILRMKHELSQGTLDDFMAYASTPPPAMVQAKAVLTAMILFCTDSNNPDPLSRDGPPIKQHQKLLFDQRIHDVTFDIIKLVFSSPNLTAKPKDVTSARYKGIWTLCLYAYRLIKQMAKANNRAGPYLFEKYHDIMQEQLGYQLKVADTLMEIVTNNQGALDLIAESDMPAFFLTLIEEKGRLARYLNFLAALCMVDGVGFRANQDLLTRILLRAKPSLLLQTKMEGGKPCVQLEKDGQTRWVEVPKFVQMKADHKELIEYFSSQIVLFTNMTLNRHQDSTRIIRGMLSAEFLLAVMSDVTVPMKIRINCVALVTNLYVDCDINEEKPVIHFIREWENIDQQRISIDQANYELILKLKEFVENELPQGNEPVSLTDPRLREYLRSQESKRGGGGRRMSVVVDTTVGHDQALQMIWNYAKAVLKLASKLVSLGFYNDRTYNLKFQDRLITILRGSQAQEDVEYQSKETFQPLIFCKLEICKILNTFFDLTINFRITDMLELYKDHEDLAKHGEAKHNQLHKEIRKNIKDKWNNFRPFTDEKQEDELRNLLADLTLYENTELVSLSLQLLVRLYTESVELSNKMKDVQLIVTRSQSEVYRTCKEQVKRMRELCPSVVNLDENLPAVETILKDWVKLLKLPDEADVKRNQNVFRHLRAHEIAFNAVKFPFSNQPNEQPRRPAMLLFYEFLTLFAKGNYDNQLLLVPIIPVMLPQMGWKLKVANTVTETFRNNRACAKQVDEALVEHFVNTIASGNVFERYLIFLKHIVYSEGLVIKENQNRVVKSLLDHDDRAMFLFKLEDQEGYDIAKVKHAISEGQLDNSDSLLNYHIALVDLLATCTLGENEFCESKCRALLSIAECLTVLVDSDIPPRMKRAFMTFLNEAYFMTDEDPVLARRRIRGPDSMQMLQQLFANIVVDLEQFCVNPHRDAETRTYLFEGVLPFCTAFFDRFFIKDDEGKMVLEELSSEASKIVDKVYAVRSIVGHDDQYSDVVCQCLKAIADSRCEGPTRKMDEIVKAANEDQEVLERKRDLLKSTFSIASDDLDSYSHDLLIEVGYPMLCRVFQEVVIDYDEFSELVDFFATALDCVIVQQGGPARPRAQEKLFLLRQAEKLGVAGKFVAGGVDMVAGGALAAAKAGVSVVEGAANVAQMGYQSLVHGDDEGSEDIARRTRTIEEPDQAEKVIKRVIEFFRKYGQRNVDQLLHYLKVFQGMVNVPDEDDEEDEGDDNEDELRNLEFAQRLMTEFGAAELVPSLLTNPNKVLASAALELSIRMLHGGNTYVQEEVMHIMNRATSVHLFQQIRDQFRQFMLEIKTRQPEDCKYIQNILRFLQLLCEGHNTELQHYLREQIGGVMSVDIVKEVATLIISFTEDFARRVNGTRKPTVSSMVADLDLFVQINDTMTEACQGPCKENQSALVEQKVCDTVDSTLETLAFTQQYYASLGKKRPELKDKYDEVVDGVRSSEGSILTMLNAIIEGNTNKIVLERMISSIDINIILNMLESHWQGAARFLDGGGPDELEGEVDLCIKYYILLRVLAENDEVSDTAKTVEKWEKTSETGCPKRMLDIVGRIEVLRGKALERIYFPVPSVAREQFRSKVLEQERSSLLYEVNRDNPGEKVSDFLNRMDDIIYVMKHQDRMSQYKNEPLSSPLRYLYYINNASFYCQWLTVLFALTLNALIICTFREHQGTTESDAVATAMSVVGVVHLLTAIGRLVSFFTSWYSVIIYRGLEGEDPPEGALMYALQASYIIVMHKQASFQILYTFFAVIGLVVDPYFYCFHLTDLLGKFRLLAYALESVTRNIASLSQTILLGFVVIYIYSVIGWRFFWEDGYEFGDAGPFNDNMLQWVLSHWDYGLRSAPLRSNPETLGFFLFGLSYFLLVVLILGAIISGIIIDTFGELRDEKASKEDDMENVCFMCGLTRDTFDQRGNGFDDHIKRDHNMWQYMFFKMHLEGTPEDDFTGQESYMVEKLDNRDCSVFPLRRAMVLEKNQDAEEDVGERTLRTVTMLEDQIAFLSQKLTQLTRREE
eukprot:Rmarinus@m.12901